MPRRVPSQWRRAIEELEKRYLAIVQIEPMAPPKWVVAAGAQVARMWADMVNEAGSLTITGKPTNGVDVGKVSRAILEQALEPLRWRAKGAAKTCLNYSVKFQYSSEYSARCEAWLSRNYPKEFPRIEELAPTPRMNLGGAASAAPVGRGRRPSAKTP